LRLIRNQADQGTAIIIASHSPAVTAQADRVIKIKDGQVQA
jgi:putative ABC transport system ATP-binding protein